MTPESGQGSPLERNLEGVFLRSQPDFSLAFFILNIGIIVSSCMPQVKAVSFVIGLVLAALAVLLPRACGIKVVGQSLHVFVWPRWTIYPLDGLALTDTRFPPRVYRLEHPQAGMMIIPAVSDWSLEETSLFILLKSRGANVPSNDVMEFFVSGPAQEPAANSPIEELDELRLGPRTLCRIIATRVHWEVPLEGAILHHEVRRGFWGSCWRQILALADGRHAVLSDWRMASYPIDTSLAEKLAERGVRSVLTDPSDAPEQSLRLLERRASHDQ